MSKDSKVQGLTKPDFRNVVEAASIEQVEMQDGLPANVDIPNETTRRTLEDTEAGCNLVVCDDVDDLFEKLGI